MINKNGCDNCKWNLDGETCCWNDERALLLPAGECEEYDDISNPERNDVVSKDGE